MATTLKLTPRESLTIRESTPDLLEVEASYAPGGRAPPKHFHPGQDEHFEVSSGSVHVRTGDHERVLRPGEEIDIPRGVAHQVWNPDAEPAVVIWQTRPALRTEQWFRSIDGLHRSGRVGGSGMPGPLAFGVLLSEYRDVFRLAFRPQPLARVALAALGALGRARGYRSEPAPGT
jgi:mannose-6-phosphate isomerase-like protein (cupin superfamily)